MEKCKAILLAAGEGTRMKSKKPKVLHEIAGKPMVKHVIAAANQCGAEDICVVVGHQAEEVRQALEGEKVSFALQEVQQGTGHAVLQGVDFIDDDKDILILYGDTPLITGETLEKLIVFHRNEKNAASIISAVVENPTGYGHIIRDSNGAFLKNVEHKDAAEEEKQQKEINTGIYCFQGKALKDALSRLTNDNVQKEYYLPDTLALIRQSGGRVNAMQTEDVTEFFGVNSKVQLAEAGALLRKRVNTYLMEECGVTIVAPEQTYIDPDVSIGRDTVILPGCVIEKGTEIGEDCVIGPCSRLTNMKLKDNVTFQASTGMDSSVGSYTNVGPYAYIRPNSQIGEHVKIGDFVEVKNSKIGDNTKVSHLTYIGDTDAGSGINFGCGTVTVNYDGKKKFRTVIEDNVFIGCNANLVAPVTIRKGSYIAAGSTITKDVPEDALAVARARQQAIEGWAKRR